MPPSSTVCVPSWKVSLVIGGRGGSQLKFMQQTLGVTLRISPRPNDVKAFQEILIIGANHKGAAQWIQRIVHHEDVWVRTPARTLVFIDSTALYRFMWPRDQTWDTRNANAWIYTFFTVLVEDQSRKPVLFCPIEPLRDRFAPSLADVIVSALAERLEIECRYCPDVTQTMAACAVLEGACVISIHRAFFDLRHAGSPLGIPVYGSVDLAEDDSLTFCTHRLHQLYNITAPMPTSEVQLNPPPSWVTKRPLLTADLLPHTVRTLWLAVVFKLRSIGDKDMDAVLKELAEEDEDAELVMALREPTSDAAVAIVGAKDKIAAAYLWAAFDPTRCFAQEILRDTF